MCLYAAGRPLRWHVAAWFVFALVSAWLLYPALTPAHVEGFSASIESIALHLQHEGMRAFDYLHPFDVKYFGLTRLGVNLAVALCIRVFNVSGTTAFRLVMWFGLALFTVSSVALIRRWAECSLIAACAIFLLIPSATDSSFFFNDNVLAAGFGVFSLMLLTVFTRIWSAICAGVLLGLAVVARTDLLLIAPAVPMILFQGTKKRSASGIDLLAFGAASLLTVVIIFSTFHTNILQVLGIAKYAILLWNRTPQSHLSVFGYFAGLPVLLSLPLGIYALVSKKQWTFLCLLAGVPLLFILAENGKLWEPRQLLPLTPFIGALSAWGLKVILNFRENTPARWLGAAYLLLFTVILAIPPLNLGIDDGPRAYVGRLWLPPIWRKWQHSVDADFSRTRQMLHSSREGQLTVVLTEDWTPDRYVHLAAQESGMAEASQTTLVAECRNTAELFQGNHSRMLHIRLHEPFVPATEAFKIHRLEELALPCLAAIKPDRGFVVLGAGKTQDYMQTWRAQNPATGFGSQKALSKPRLYPITIYRLDSELMSQLHNEYRVQEKNFWAHQTHSPQVGTLQTAEKVLAH